MENEEEEGEGSLGRVEQSIGTFIEAEEKKENDAEQRQRQLGEKQGEQRQRQLEKKQEQQRQRQLEKKPGRFYDPPTGDTWSAECRGIGCQGGASKIECCQALFSQPWPRRGGTLLGEAKVFGDVIHCLNPAAQDLFPLSQPARKGELCFYCERKFGQQAFLGEKCPTENFWVDESLESDSAKSESAESESARSLSVEIVESVRSWSVRGESAGGDEGVCVGLGVNGVSAGVQVWSSWKFSECGKGDID